jgi:O-antigen ligase
MFYFLSEIESREEFVIGILFALLVFEIYFSFSPILKDISSDSLIFRSVKYSGLAANVNITSFSLVFKLPILLYLISNVKTLLKKIPLSILLIISLYIIFILGTRGAFLALFICFGVYLFSLIINYKTIKNHLSGLFLIVLSVILSVTFNLNSSFIGNNTSVIERASSISVSTKDGSVNQRLRYYKHSLSQFLETPFKGIGIGNWKLKSISYDKYEINGYTVPYHAHNDFIQILAEQGFFGFLFYVMVFLSTILIILKRKLISINSPYTFLIGSFFIFILDSNLNFPISRPISQLQFILIIALISTNQKD